MPKTIDIRVLPEIAASEEELKRHISQKTRVGMTKIRHFKILKRSIDARKRPVVFNLRVLVFMEEPPPEDAVFDPGYQDVSKAREVHIVGAGPAGLFAALKLLENGLRPVIWERGKDVRARRRDLAAIHKLHLVNEDSNYCFGEGGAGTYSDGKLYTRSRKRGDVDRILKILVAHGADSDILVNAHPHIGTNKLPVIITAIRERILEYGGRIHFNSRVTDIYLSSDRITGLVINDEEKVRVDQVILATGHSARDIYRLLYSKGIEIESKPFALGVRVEHPQVLIDQLQYKCSDRGPYLPPASYSLAKQVRGRGVYSFCMCPGGIIAPCATSPGEIVTNGWSPSKRNQSTANSGIVVELTQKDFIEFAEEGPLAGMAFQSSIEQKAWQEAGRTQCAPAQKLNDFIENRTSADLPKTSYQPGITSVPLKTVLPSFINDVLQDGFKEFGKQMKSFLSAEAIVHAPESRTSAPVRIPRNPISLEHVRIQGLYPCGEGAGYAGGIVSAAIDGEKCADQCLKTAKS